MFAAVLLPPLQHVVLIQRYTIASKQYQMSWSDRTNCIWGEVEEGVFSRCATQAPPRSRSWSKATAHPKEQVEAADPGLCFTVERKATFLLSYRVNRSLSHATYP